LIDSEGRTFSKQSAIDRTSTRPNALTEHILNMNYNTYDRQQEICGMFTHCKLPQTKDALLS